MNIDLKMPCAVYPGALQKFPRNLIAVLRLEDYQMLNLKTLNLPVLYVGSGFHEQYQFQISYKGRIGERDGVLLERGRNQVIRLCETE